MSKKIKRNKRPGISSEIQERFNTAVHYYQAGLPGQAQKALGEIIAQTPSHMASYKLLADIAMQTGQADIAIPILKRVVDQNRQNSVCRGYLADLLSHDGQYPEAIIHYEKEIALSSKNKGSGLDQLLINTAIAYNNSGNPSAAINKLEMAIGINDRNTLAYYLLASTYQAIGNFDKAENYAKRSLHTDPLYAKSLYILSIIDRDFFSRELIETISAAVTAQRISIEDRVYLSFTLYHIFEATGNFAEAFRFLEIGNHLKRQTINYSFDRQAAYFRKTRETLSRFLAVISNEPSPPIIPIIIVGMPRSGTTLVEQIIASHEKVTAGGEIITMSQIAQSIMHAIYSRAPLDVDSVINADNLNKYREIYSTAISGLIDGNRKFITDKMPQNFFYLGLMKSLFPAAKIIHCKRNSMATTFSCYKTLFTAQGQEFSYDLQELGKFHQLYQETIEYWETLIPESILDIQYERIIEDPEAETRKILDFCDLQWDENCREFYKTKRTVSTASVMQVRKPIYKSSLAIWKNYEKNLGPLIDALAKSRK
ncbi:MAG: sulfotransferase [Desulfobulbales bacterium]|nr:sulfotransferase [Desulfobulbales bacterium]